MLLPSNVIVMLRISYILWSKWLMYSVRWWGRRRCNFVCGTKGIAAKMHSTPRPRVSCNWLSSVRLRWMICTLLPYWCILIWMICTLLMHFLGGFRNCVTHVGRVWPSRQASHQVGRSTIYMDTREVSYPTMANANLRIAQQCKGFKALVKLLLCYVNVSNQSLIFIHKTNMLNSIFRYFSAFNVLNMTRTGSWIQKLKYIYIRNSP